MLLVYLKTQLVVFHLRKFKGFVDENQKTPQYDLFKCGKVPINSSLKKGKIYKLQYSSLKREKQHDGIYEDTWEARENDWLPNFKNDLLSTAFCYTRYTMGMEELTNFGMKNSLTLPSLARKYFNSSRDENDEPIYTYTDPFMQKIVQNSIKGVDAQLSANIANLNLVIIYSILSQKN